MSRESGTKSRLEEGIGRKEALSGGGPCWEVRSLRDLTKMFRNLSVRV